MFKSNQSAIIRYTWIFIILTIIGVFMITATILPVFAQSTGTISGQVTDQITGVGIPNLWVYADFSGWGMDACTDANGYYTISTVPLDTPFRVLSGGENWCAGGETNYAQEFWQQTLDWGSAILLTLDSGNPDATGIDFTLEVGGQCLWSGNRSIDRLRNTQHEGWHSY